MLNAVWKWCRCFGRWHACISSGHTGDSLDTTWKLPTPAPFGDAVELWVEKNGCLRGLYGMASGWCPFPFKPSLLLPALQNLHEFPYSKYMCIVWYFQKGQLHIDRITGCLFKRDLDLLMRALWSHDGKKTHPTPDTCRFFPSVFLQLKLQRYLAQKIRAGNGNSQSV